MSLIQDKLGGEFLRPGGCTEAGFGPGMLMFSHLPPVASFARLTGQSVVAELQPHELILKKERHSPDCSADTGGGGGLPDGAGNTHGAIDYLPAMGIKQEKVSELDYRLPLYSGDAGQAGTELLDMSMSNHQSLLVHDLSMGNLSGRLGKDSSEKKGRRSNGEGQGGKMRRKRGESKSTMLDQDGETASPSCKPHVCEHCSAAFRSSYHLRRHVLIHTGERPFRCSQCNMSFIQKYLLQRHEKIHSGEKPFSCDQCNMRFIQKYHMERHKRTHSGEKPYRCDTCQQYFSRTDRLLKHKRTCGDTTRKGPDGEELGSEDDGGHGSSADAQGNAGVPGRKRGKSKTGGRRKKALGALHGPGAEGYGAHGFSTVDGHGLSLSEPENKGAFRKGHRKGSGKGGESKPDSVLTGNAGLDQQGSGNYDDAVQFLKKRRYLNTPGGAPGYDVGVGHVQSQPVAVQCAVSGAMEGEACLGLLDSSALVDIKPDRLTIPDEVLHTLLEHYGYKSDMGFDLSHMELEPGVADGADPLGADANAGGERASIMQEYSRFLLQALERTSHSGGFVLGPTPPSSSSFPTYSASPVEFSFPLPPSSSSPKSHLGLLGSSSPLQGFHHGLDHPLHSHPQLSHQQLTPSQELTDHLVKPLAPSHPAPNPHAYHVLAPPVDPHAQKNAQAPKNFPAKGSYQIENFAQAFGGQFKPGRRAPGFGTDSGVDQFSGYSSLLADVSDTKGAASQSYD